jgi:hypothetical protein
VNATAKIESVPVINPLGTQINTVLEKTTYRMANFSLLCLTSKGQQAISNFVVMPTEVITKDNGRTEEKLVKVVGYLANEELPEVSLSLKEFERMDWVASKWGLKPIIHIGQNNTQHIRQVAQRLGNAYAKHTTIYTHTGWKCVDGDWAYLHGGGAIGTKDAIVELDGNISKYTFPDSSENYKKAVAASNNFRDAAPPDVTIPLLSLAYLCPLNEFFKQSGLEPSFIAMIVGQTSSMKSTLAALTLNHFGASFSAKNLPGSFKDTANALEAKASMLKDTLNVIDDYYPTIQQGEYSKMAVTMQSLIRAYGDRSGRGRLTADAKLKDTYIPLGNLLVTGEDIPRVEESGLARLFLLDIEPGQVNKKAVSELQGKTELLGQAMRGYVEWLTPQAGTLKDTLAQKFTDYRKRAQSGDGHLRLAETVAWLYIGYEMFVDYAIKNGVLQDADRQATLDEAWAVLTGLSDKQQKRIANDNPVTMFLSALNELFATQKCTCLTFNNDEFAPNRDIGSQRGFLGYMDSKYYYLFPSTTMAAIKDFYKRQEIRFPSSMKMLLKQLHAKDMIEVSVQQDRLYRTKTKIIDDINHRFIWLKSAVLEKLKTTEE